MFMEQGIEIEHGCTETPDGRYEYTTHLVEPLDTVGKSIYKTYPFTSVDGKPPKIGDFIVEGLLVRRTKPKVNADWRMWKDKDLYGNP